MVSSACDLGILNLVYVPKTQEDPSQTLRGVKADSHNLGETDDIGDFLVDSRRFLGDPCRESSLFRIYT